MNWLRQIWRRWFPVYDQPADDEDLIAVAMECFRTGKPVLGTRTPDGLSLRVLDRDATDSEIRKDQRQ